MFISPYDIAIYIVTNIPIWLNIWLNLIKYVDQQDFTRFLLVILFTVEER